MKERILIVGASARPWIRSALQAGLNVSAYDLFGDWDAQAMLRNPAAFEIGANPSDNGIQAINSFDELLSSRHHIDIASCDIALVFGGFESWSEGVHFLSKQVPVLGTSSTNLARLVDSPAVFRFLGHGGIPVPDTQRRFGSKPSVDGWLCKKIGTSGGLGVRWADPGDRPIVDPNSYFQKYIEGTSYSGVFVSGDDCGQGPKTRMLGVTEQLVGERRLGAKAFAYVGSLGPVTVPRRCRIQMQTIGSHLGREYHLRGLWGIDFVVALNGSVHPVDVNPRLTASMELFEAPVGRSESGLNSMVDVHVSACRGELSGEQVRLLQQSIKASARVELGKAILFHPGNALLKINQHRFSQLRPWFDPTFDVDPEAQTTIADVPTVGQSIPPGSPILTVRVRAGSGEARHCLFEFADKIYRQLGLDLPTIP